ncbi:MAG: helix-turn-helix domain-containing protein [Bacteroidales bacterium]|jgi:transcriptional regulator with XRE-family HTH domain|nr:helix-turn-helix domain-containing protein [Bacteroidales bacterium]
MESIGERISRIRKCKALTQEELSDRASINIRTLQRIENGENEPRGHTLNAICEVLKINVEDILDFGKTEDRSFLIYMHLSVITGICLPWGDIIIPLILWLTRKKSIISVKEQGINILNFRICWNICYCMAIGAYIYAMSVPKPHISLGLSGVYVCLVHLVVTLLYPVFIAISIRRRKKMKFYYPRWIRIIR